MGCAFAFGCQRTKAAAPNWRQATGRVSGACRLDGYVIRTNVDRSTDRRKIFRIAQEPPPAPQGGSRGWQARTRILAWRGARAPSLFRHCQGVNRWPHLFSRGGRSGPPCGPVHTSRPLGRLRICTGPSISRYLSGPSGPPGGPATLQNHMGNCASYASTLARGHRRGDSDRGARSMPGCGSHGGGSPRCNPNWGNGPRSVRQWQTQHLSY